MSQHIFITTRKEKRVKVLMGWDRPLLGFFLVVEDIDAVDDSYIYSNLEDQTLFSCMGLPKNIAYFQVKLAELGVLVPDQMILEILSDKERNIGNRVVNYDKDGNMYDPEINL